MSARAPASEDTLRRPPQPRIDATLARLPAGTVARAVSLLQRGLAAVERAGGDPVETDAEAASEHLVRPLVLVEDWPEPTEPLPVGSGAIHADLIDDDHDALARLRESLDGPVDAERLAAEAQRWRLPVTPYRRPGNAATAVAGGPGGPDPEPISGRGRQLSERLVVDLSALWAGPLATSLLAEAGARVVKIDPSCRPDAFGEHPALYRHLNGAKEIVDLDLRVDGDRRRFERLVAEADLVVDSFSRRVMPNLGYDHAQLRALNPAVATLSLVAFPSGSDEAHWVSYGPGVHAASGLAVVDVNRERASGPGAFRPAPIAYPDVLGGLEVFAIAAELLSGEGPHDHREVSLAEAISPLLGAGPPVEAGP